MRIDRWVAGAMAIGLALSAPAQADWKREYDRGLKAVESGDWAEAESRFKLAIGEDSQPDARKRFAGVVFRPYVPHYYAGLAAARQGDCARALEYWQHAATNQVLRDLPDLRAEQQRGVSTCQTRLAQQQPPPSQPVASAEPPPAVATPPKPAPTPAPEPAKPAPTRPAQPVATTTAPASSPAPALLRSAVEGYLAGRYQEVLRINAASAGDARARAHVHLLRAAAGYTLAEQNGGDAQLLNAAKRDVVAARSALASISPDAVLFSPRFRGFWQQTR